MRVGFQIQFYARNQRFASELISYHIPSFFACSMKYFTGFSLVVVLEVWEGIHQIINFVLFFHLKFHVNSSVISNLIQTCALCAQAFERVGKFLYWLVVALHTETISNQMSLFEFLIAMVCAFKDLSWGGCLEVFKGEWDWHSHDKSRMGDWSSLTAHS